MKILISTLVAICCAIALEAIVISIAYEEEILAPTLRSVFEEQKLRHDQKPMSLLFHYMVANALYFIVPGVIIALTATKRKDTESSASGLKE